MTFLTTHPFLAIVLAVLASALIALFVGGVMRALAETMPGQSDIEPGDFGSQEVATSVAVELKSLGFEVKAWGPEIQITDHEGLTFYMPMCATLEQCLERYAVKVQQFKAA